jgi:hypothetical protein
MSDRWLVDEGVYVKETSNYIITEWMFLYSDGEIEFVKQVVAK